VLAYRSFDQRPVSRGNLGASGMTIRTPIEDALFSVNGCVRCAGRPPSAGRNPMSSTGAGLAGTQSQSTVSPPKPPVHARTHARTTHRTTAPTLCRASQIGPKIGSHFSSSSTGAGSLPLAAPPLSQHASETKPGRVRPWLGVCNRSRVRRRGGCRRGRAVAVEVSASRRTYKWRTVRSRSRQGHWGDCIHSVCAWQCLSCSPASPHAECITARPSRHSSTAVRRARRQHATRDVAASNAASDAGLSAHSEAPRAAAPTDGARGRSRHGGAVRCSAVQCSACT
jgi:hypothetical protein